MYTYTPKQSMLSVGALTCCFTATPGKISTSKVQKTSLLTRFGITSLLVTVLFVAPSSPIYAAGFPTVNCDAPGSDLQKAIDNGAEGDKIFLTGICDDGPYFIFGKNVKLQGWSSTGATLSSMDSESVLIVRGATVGLRNLTIDADGSGHGISMEGSSIDVERVVVQNASGVGMNIDGSSFAIVINSEFNNNGEGIVVTGSSNAFLHENTLQGNSSSGITVVGNSSATLSNNTIIGNHIGALVTKMSSLILVNNLIENNLDKGIWVAHQYGYLSTEGTVNTVQGNGTDVVCNVRGIFESEVAQSSTSYTTSLYGCTVLGTVF